MIGAQLQIAVHGALKEASVCAARIYDRVPGDPVFPYVTIGDERVNDDSNQCGDGWDISFEVHVYSRPKSTSKVEVKTEAAYVRDAIVAISAVGGFSLVSIEHTVSVTRRLADGLTEHCALTFRAIIDPA